MSRIYPYYCGRKSLSVRVSLRSSRFNSVSAERKFDLTSYYAKSAILYAKSDFIIKRWASKVSIVQLFKHPIFTDTDCTVACELIKYLHYKRIFYLFISFFARMFLLWNKNKSTKCATIADNNYDDHYFNCIALIGETPIFTRV